MKYRAEIDGLRALAVLPVILFHAGFEWFSGGFVGVDVFFVISGYLITTIIISEMAEGNFSIVNFYERRARRILPALFLVMLACLPFAWLWLTPSDLKNFGQSLIAVSTFSSNILFWQESGYFATAAELKPLLHTWSLAVEEQYYIVFPVFLLITWRLGVKWVLALLTIVFLISLGVAHWGAFYHPNLTFYLLPTRGWEVLIGVFAAFYLKHNNYLKSHNTNQVLSLLGFGMIVYAIVMFNESTPFPSLYALVPTVGTGLLILSAVSNTLVHKLLSFSPIVGMGLISYSAYLWHQPIFAFARHRSFGELSDLFVIMLCISSFLLAYISWRWVERPFRDKEKTTRKMIFGFSLIGIIMFSSLGFIAHTQDGFYGRINSELEIETSFPSPFREDCHFAENRIAPRCEYFGGPVEWASFGDSHMVEISYALAEALRIDQKGMQHNTFSDCRPILNDPSMRCSEWTANTLEKLMDNSRIKNVVVSYRLTIYLYGEHLGIYPTLPDDKLEEERSKIWTDLLLILQLLIDSNKNVYFILQPPELPVSIERLMLYNTAENKLEGVSRDWWNERYHFVYENLDAFPKEVMIIDPIDLFCDEKRCYANDQDGYLYFDDDHVSIHGARKIVDKFIPQSIK